MNEQILKLAEQAGMYVDLDGKPWPKWMGAEECEVAYARFAELLVQECARVARATPAPNFHEHLKQQLGHTWDMAASEAGHEIVKHFGVEE